MLASLSRCPSLQRFDTFFGQTDGDLYLCPEMGMAYQIDRTKSVPYDAEYWFKYVGYESTPMDDRLNAIRVGLAAMHGKHVLDVGIGSGSFLRACLVEGLVGYGYDVNPVAIDWLKEQGRFADPYSREKVCEVVTCWDSFEHLAEPDRFLLALVPGQVLLIALPIYFDLRSIRGSKHYRPDEHYTYWTPWGLASYLASFGYELLSYDLPETRAGRESIGTFAFQKVK